MKKQGKKLFKIVAFLVFFFSIGSYSHYHSYSSSNSNLTSYHTELTLCGNNVENSFTQNIDPADEDQIDQSCKSGLINGPLNQNKIAQNSSLIYEISFAVWQPPKIF